jgi:hypothetical protein
MIPAGMGANTVFQCLGRKLFYRIDSAACFECPNFLDILTFKQYFTLKHFIDGPGGKDGSMMDEWGDSPCCQMDLLC